MELILGTTILFVDKQPVNALIPHATYLNTTGESVDLPALLATIDESIYWWQSGQTSADTTTRARAEQSIAHLSFVRNDIAARVADGQGTAQLALWSPEQSDLATACPHCGGANRLTSRFCRCCGVRLARQQEMPTMPPSFQITTDDSE